MKHLSLNNLGVHELDAREMVLVDGGNFPTWVWRLIRDGVAYEAIKWCFENHPGVEPGFYHPGKM